MKVSVLCFWVCDRLTDIFTSSTAIKRSIHACNACRDMLRLCNSRRSLPCSFLMRPYYHYGVEYGVPGVPPALVFELLGFSPIPCCLRSQPRIAVAPFLAIPRTLDFSRLFRVASNFIVPMVILVNSKGSTLLMHNFYDSPAECRLP